VIQSDPTRLRQILLNLLGNAIKFTEVGSVTVSVHYDVDERNLSFCISDTGIGMSPEQRDAIARFDAFAQADNSTTRKFGGSGLGLRICNSLAGMLGGGISVESEAGVGSRFTSTIGIGSQEPVDLVTEEQLRSTKTLVDAMKSITELTGDSPLSDLKILLAEDGPDNQRLISFHLRKEGAEVEIAENGLVAVERIDETAPDDLPHVILMDMQMPEMDGYAATRYLRDQGIKIPIIALTAHAMAGDRQKCLNAGCDDYLIKPIDREKLIETCHSWGRRSPTNPVLAASPLSTNAWASESPAPVSG
jgi:CheY-like chemotaxis protein/anti-sigma regulatory factor (Ser/Thr protein kinase)